MAYPNFINSKVEVDNTNKTYTYVRHGNTLSSPFSNNNWIYNETEQAMEAPNQRNWICSIFYPIDLYVYDTFKNLKLTLVAKTQPTATKARLQFLSLRTNRPNASPNTMYLRMNEGSILYNDRSARYNQDLTPLSDDDVATDLGYVYPNSSGITMSDQYFKDAYHTHEVTISNGRLTYKVDGNICVNNQELPSEIRKFSYTYDNNNTTQQLVYGLLIYEEVDLIYLKSLTVTSEVYMLDSITGSYTQNGITTYYRTSFAQTTYGSNVVNYVSILLKSLLLILVKIVI